METREFFQDEAKRCRDNAERSARKDDREFWLNLAGRWEGLLRPKDGSDAGVADWWTGNDTPFRSAGASRTSGWRKGNIHRRPASRGGWRPESKSGIAMAITIACRSLAEKLWRDAERIDLRWDQIDFNRAENF
jgi:hypothetical protein